METITTGITGLDEMNKNLSVINDSILNMGKSVHGDGEIEDMHF